MLILPPIVPAPIHAAGSSALLGFLRFEPCFSHTVECMPVLPFALYILGLHITVAGPTPSFLILISLAFCLITFPSQPDFKALPPALSR